MLDKSDDIFLYFKKMYYMLKLNLVN